MKKLLILTTVLLLALSCVADAQVVVGKASKLLWDDPNPVGSVTQFRVYAQRTPIVIPDGVSFVAEITVTEWTISSDIGSWWVVVTAVNDDGTSVVESGPSNEVHYIVIGPPTDVRVVR